MSVVPHNPLFFVASSHCTVLYVLLLPCIDAVSKSPNSPVFKVPFLVDIGSLATLINQEVIQKLGYKDAQSPDNNSKTVPLLVDNVRVYAFWADFEPFDGINVLGADVLRYGAGSVNIDFKQLSMTLR